MSKRHTWLRLRLYDGIDSGLGFGSLLCGRYGTGGVLLGFEGLLVNVSESVSAASAL